MEKQEIKQAELRLSKVTETGYFSDIEIFNSEFPLDADLLRVEFGFKVDIQQEKNTLILHVLVKYSYPINEINTRILELTTSNHFEIKDLINLVAIENNQLNDKSGILPSLLGICIGTIRGILVVKTAGTVLADYPLPVFNPTDILGVHPPKKQK